MQESKQEELVNCNQDCFNCQYADCVLSVVPIEQESLTEKEIKYKAYQKKYRKDHKDKLVAQQREWYEKNRESCLARRRAISKNQRLEKLNICSYCHKETGQAVMIYHRKVYCSDECLKEYLLLKAKQKEVRVIEKEDIV